MAVFVALYRGINVGGKAVVKMEALRAMHEGLGHRKVRNYIQSGNVVFEARGSGGGLAKKLAAAFVEEFGFAARVLVVSADQWREIVGENPYAAQAGKNPKTVHVGICQNAPSVDALSQLLAKTGGKESFSARGNVLYLHAPEGFGTSKFAAGMEKACGVAMTVRNWRTVEALARLLNE